MRLLRLLVVLVLCTSLPFSAAAAPPADGPRLHLHRAIIETQTSSRVASTLLTPTLGPYAIIQFNGPITLADRAALEATGVTLLEYIPDFAYLVRGVPEQIKRAATLPNVYTQSPFTLADKLAPALLRLLARGASDVGGVSVIGWPDDKGELARDLGTRSINTSAPLRADELLQVASLPSVRWIEPKGHPRIVNDVARSIMHVNAVWQNRSLFGVGQTVAVLDSGLDTGLSATLSPDFVGRLVATHVLSPTGDLADQNGHGTHVAGSVAGAGVQSGAITVTHQYSGSFAGIAPEAGMVVQAFEVDGGSGEIIGLGTDYYLWFNQAYQDGARLHTNSWGDNTGPITDTQAAYGGYPYGSQRTDQFMWDHPDMTIFFAAGNSGKDGTPGAFGFCTGGDGVVDPDSLLAPGTAKNVITVGASESSRNTGGLAGTPWILLNLCFGVNPVATDPVSDNANGMAAFSSRGPTDDGRIKPDIVAPGTNIVSNQSHYPGASTLWGSYNADYAYSGGTSMATPLTAGTAVLVRQWLTTRGFANPSAAAVKATLLNTTADMAPGQYGTGTTQEIPFTRPNSVNGWGRADLNFITAASPYALWLDDHTTGIATGQLITYVNTLSRPLQVLTNTQPLRVMLAWTDPPASLSASKQLVNDLDLIVFGPAGAVYYGNNVSLGDRTNNVEGVIIPNPPLGQYTVQVRAYDVPMASQPYALVVGGLISTQGQLTLAKTSNPSTQVAPGGLLTYTLALSAGSQPITQTITLSDALPINTTFVSASNGGTQTGPGGSVIQWTVPALAANTTITRSLVVQVGAGLMDNTPIVNASYRADNGVDLPGTGAPVTVTVQSVPSGTLTLSKVASPAAEVAPGGLITYTLSVGVQGGALNSVVLSDTLPVSTTFVSASGSFTLIAGPGSMVVWSLGNLTSGQTSTRTFTVSVLPETPRNTPISNANYQVSGMNTATITGSPVNVTVQPLRLWLPLIMR